MTSRIPHVEYTFDTDGIFWHVRQVRMREALSTPFDGELHLVTRAEVSTAGVVGLPGVLTMLRGEQERIFRGVITAADVRAAGRDVVAFVRFESPLAILRRSRRHRIFQDCTALDIWRELVGSLGPIAEGMELAVSADTAGDLMHREFAVQYGESDLDFMRRLLEDEGRTWFVAEDRMSATLHIDQGISAFAVPPGTEGRFPIIEDQFDEAAQESVQALALRVELPVASAVERAWDWTRPEIAEARAEAVLDGEPASNGSSLPAHEFHHLRRGAADDVESGARREYERLDAQRYRGAGRSNVTAFAPGTRVVIVTPPGVEIDVIVTEVEHRGDCPEVSLGETATGPNYTNAFECHPLEVPYRPQRTTPRPRIHSLHTAVVTGPAGEEIQTDTHGRIKVRMHWDRSGGPDEDASCWLRVAQSWAGNGWGSSFIPRVGMEVLVAFLDGDPDRPLCVGSVYNGGNQTPYALPDDKTKSTIRTQSSPGGDGYNELTFEDAAGAEEVYVRAQRNLRTQVLHNESRSVGADQSVSIGHDQTLAVEGDRHSTIKGNHTLAIDGGGTEGVKGSQVTVNGDVEIDVTGTGVVKITAATRIELHVGASSIVMDGQTIMFHAGAGTMQRLDEAALVMAGRGSLMRLSSTVMVNAATGATLQMDGVQTTLASNAGSHITLSDTATVGAGLGAVLELTADATINAATITAKAGQGSTLTLDANAAMMGLEASCTGHGGSLKVGPSGAALDGTKVDITAAAAASVVAPMVKIN